jgi:multidrug resistance efflux pump
VVPPRPSLADPPRPVPPVPHALDRRPDPDAPRAGSGAAAAGAPGASARAAARVGAAPDASAPAAMAPPTAARGATAARGVAAASPLLDPVALLSLQRELGGCDAFDEAAALLCTRLAPALGAARVVLAWRGGRRTASRPLAASGLGLPEWDAESRRRLGAVADEAIDQGRTLACPPAPGTRAVLRAHEALRREGGTAAVITAPVARGGRPLGALVAEFESPPPVGAAHALERAASLAAPWLALLDARRPGPVARAAAALGLGRAGAARPRRRVAAALAALALAALAFVPVDLTVSAPARVEGEVQRTVAAPVRGYLRTVYARPGDRVREGQVLAELGDRDLELDRARLASEVAQHEGAAGAAMARGERGAMAVSQAKADEARARLGLVEHQLDAIRLRAPIDGLLIQGDLARTIGAPVDRGQSLFVVAPADRFRVIVELDERDLERVRPGQRGRIALSALPWDTMPLEVLRIAPAASVVDARNVFELEARLDGPVDGLRPGLRGVAHLDGERGPLLAQWGRRLADRLATLAWRWLP